ncbi:merozoite surface protein 9, putative [Plasmodium chabaudi chabaudi]|uniref:Merozoite surface protein 9, putative n=1 Tax=Plasmodium chabaudi chabaudi TaxID=31271 RepID=A0A4V6M9X3_PLACU|nr:merozoite surface protein 9, putative [Plasmodium chabaudi chabaudi]VTZ71130.1 merozoite surface protein 9, putative [Plasmodium chabaudi chabaudi]|eukprot:XP_016654999.1 merozoite surface protein 9, putative [Plasmodium chabaudi chabaudi]
MKAGIVAFPLLMIALGSKSADAFKAKTLETKINYGILNNYEELVKIARCQYCLTALKPAEDEKCDTIMNECKNMLTDKEYGFLLKAITGDDKPSKSPYISGKHSNTLRKIIKVLEAQSKNIESLKTTVHNIKKKGVSKLKASGANNPELAKLNTSIQNIKKGFQFLSDNYNIINKHINIPNNDMNQIYSKILNSNAFGELSASPEKTDSTEESSEGINDIIKSSFQDIFEEGENIMNVVKTVLVQESDEIGNDLAGLIEKGKEIGEQFVGIEGLLSPKNGLFSAGLPSLDKLYSLTTNLSSYEELLIKLKDVVLSKLKDILLRLLYKSYIAYRKNKALELGEEEVPIVSEDEYLNELKKGVLQLTMKLLYSKVKRLLTKIKNKIFKKNKGIVPEPLPVEVPEYNFGDDDKVIVDGASASSNKSSPHMKLFRGTPSPEKAILSSIDKMINEIDLYEQVLSTDKSTDAEYDDTLAIAEGMDETESDEAELSNEHVQKIINENIAIDAINDLLKIDEPAVEDNASQNKPDNVTTDVEKDANNLINNLETSSNIMKKIVGYVIKEKLSDLAEELSDDKLEDKPEAPKPSDNITPENTPVPTQA